MDNCCGMGVDSHGSMEDNTGHFKDDFNLSSCRGAQPLAWTGHLPLAKGLYLFKLISIFPKHSN